MGAARGRDRASYLPDFSGLPEMLTKKEVAEATRLSLSSVNRLLAEGRLAAFRPTSRRTLVSRRSVEALFSHPFNL